MLLWLRDAPSLLAPLLALKGPSDCPAALVVEDSALRVAFPVEVSPDLALRATGSPRWYLLEVQRRIDVEKARRWPLAMAAMADRYGPDGELIVITTSRAVARWAMRVAVHRVGVTAWGVRPRVILLGEAEAEALLAGAPELAVFAAWAMQGRRGPAALSVVRRAIARTSEVTDERL